MFKKLVCMLNLIILITFNIHLFSSAADMMAGVLTPWPSISVSDPKYRTSEDIEVLNALGYMQISQASDGGLKLYFSQYEKFKTETAADKEKKIEDATPAATAAPQKSDPEYHVSLVFQEEAIYKVSGNELAANKGVITLSPAQLSSLDMDHTIDGTLFGVVLSKDDPEGEIPKESGDGEYYNVEGDQFIIGNTYDNQSPNWQENSLGIGFYFKYDDPNKQAPVDPNGLTTPKPAKDRAPFNQGATSTDGSSFSGNTSIFGKNGSNQGGNNTSINTDVNSQQAPKSGSTTFFSKGTNSSARDTGTSPELKPEGGSTSIFLKNGSGGAKPAGNGEETQINPNGGTTSIFSKGTNFSSGKDTVAPDINLDGGSTSIFGKGSSGSAPVSSSIGGASAPSGGGSDMPLEALFAAIASIVALLFICKLFSH